MNDDSPAAAWKRGYVQLYTGPGKGKTTAALGLTLRAVGAGLRVFFGQFIKNFPYSELRGLEYFGDHVTVRQWGRGCFITGPPTPADLEAAAAGLAEAHQALTSGHYHVVVLDEALCAADLKLFPVDDLLELIDAKCPATELVLTGRGAPPAVVARADLVTEMAEVRHYYAAGVKARVGIER